MKTKILSIFSILAVALGFTACDDHNYGPELTDEGTLSFASFDVKVESSEVEIESRADIDISDYTVKIINDKSVTVNSFVYSDLPEIIALPVGDYTVKVESHAVQKAEFDRPYYAGSKTISIKSNAVTDAGTITCTFASIRVSIRYADSLKPLLGDDVAVRVKANDNGELTFTRDETRSGYFEAVDGSTTLVAIFEGTVNGVSQWLRTELTDVQAGQHRIITFRIKGMPEPPAETGSIDLSGGISVDASIVTVDKDGNVTVEEDVLDSSDRPGQEEPEETPDDPTPPVDDTADVSMTSELDFDNPNLTTETVSPGYGQVNIHVGSGLAHLYLEVTSNDSEFAGIALAMFGEGKFDIANPPSEESMGSLDKLGIDNGDAIRGETDVIFDITQFIPMLDGFYNGANGANGIHSFKLNVVGNDANEDLTKTLTFIAERK